MPDRVPDSIKAIGDEIHFDATHYWVDGEYDAVAFLAALKAQSPLEDYEDERGNRQSAVRLDYDPNGRNGFWVTVPESVRQTTINSAVGSYPAKLTEREQARTQREAERRDLYQLTQALDSLPDDEPITKASLLAALRGA